MLLTDDPTNTTGTQLEAAAETARKAAFQSLIHWHGQPLLWTSSRAGLFDFLRIPAPTLSAETLRAIRTAQAAAGTSDHAALQTTANDLYLRDSGGGSGHLRNASIVLWLAAHQPSDWAAIAHDRPRLLAIIDDWIDQHVSPHEIAALAEVTTQLITEADSTRAVSRPRGAADSGDADAGE